MRTISGVDALTLNELTEVLERELGLSRYRVGELARTDSPELPAHVILGKRKLYPRPAIDRWIAAERAKIAAVIG